MEKTFEDTIPTFVDKMAQLSMEDVFFAKNRDKFIKEEISNKVDIAKSKPETNSYDTKYFNKAIKERRRQLAEEKNPLGARTGRATMKDGGKGIEALRQVAPDVVKRMGYQEGGEMGQQMDMLMGMEQEQTMLPDEEMEEDYVDYVIEETLSNEDRNYLIDALEKDDRLSVIFDQVVETAHEFSGSGTIEGPGTGKSDSIPARLSDGEFVITAKATEEIGADNLMSMMKDAEAAADERQMAYDGGMMREEKDVMVAPKEPVQQNINVTKSTVDNGAAMPQAQQSPIKAAIKEDMMLDPYQRHVRS